MARARIPEYPGDFPRSPLEPDLHHYCRWVVAREYHPAEPHFLGWVRKMKDEAPVKFAEFYEKQKQRMEQLEKEMAADGPATSDVGECVAMVEKLIKEYEAKNVH